MAGTSPHAAPLTARSQPIPSRPAGSGGATPAVANQAWPRVDGHPWTSDHFAALRNDGKFSTPLLEMARTGSDTGPASKTERLITLASHLDTADAVPDQLRNVFDELIAVAAHPPGAADL